MFVLPAAQQLRSLLAKLKMTLADLISVLLHDSWSWKKHGRQFGEVEGLEVVSEFECCIVFVQRSRARNS